MKKLLSALTALCMCASMTTGLLPASALTAITPDDAVIAKAGDYERYYVEGDTPQINGFTWQIDDVEFDPATDKTISVPIKVWNCEPISGYTLGLLVDGMTLASDADNFPFSAVRFKDNKAFPTQATFMPNTDELTLGVAADANLDNPDSVIESGAAVVTLIFVPKEGYEYKPGQKFNITFSDEKDANLFGNNADQQLKPTLLNGSITVKGGTEDTTTEPTTEAPTEPVATTTEPQETQPSSGDFEWKISDVTFDPSKDERIEVPILVYNSPEISGYNIGLLIDGKAPSDPDFPFDKATFKNGGGYDNTGSFVPNTSELTLAFASDMSGDRNTSSAANGATAVYLYLTPKAGYNYEHGHIYQVTFDTDTPQAVSFGVASSDGGKDIDLYPKLTNGSITVENPDVTEPPTEYNPETSGIVSKEEKVSSAQWVISSATAKPGEKVTLHVTIKDNDGFNSYIAKIKTDVTAVGAETGELSELDFSSNINKMTFAGTDFSSDTINSNGTVFDISFTAPDKPGRYPVDFSSLEVYNADMVRLIPSTELGYITVEDDEFVHDQKDTSAKWIIDKVEADPGETVKVPVKVQGDTDGLNSYMVQISQDAGPVLVSAESGSAYGELSFESNLKKLTFGGTNSDKGENIIAKDGDVFYMNFEVPKDAAPDTTYHLNFVKDALDLENIDMVQLKPATEDGWIHIRKADFEHKEKEVSTKWIIDEVHAKPGEEVTVPVRVEGNTEGFNSFMTKIKYADGPVLVSTANGGFASLDFSYNLDNMTFGGTDFTTGSETLSGDEIVFNLTFTAPNEPGIYPVEFVKDTLEVYGIDMVQQISGTQDGAIIVDAEETTTTEPGEKDGAKWIIDWKEAKPGEEVTLPVHVEGNTEGFNSFMTKIKVADGPILVSTANGGFATLDFNYNLDNMTFGGTDSSSGADLKDDDVVFNLTFTAPTEPGEYAVDFDGLEVYGLDMAKQIVVQQNGGIIVKDDETTTEPGEKNGAKWIIDEVHAKPGEEVVVPVHVEGNTEGFNSFMTKIKVADGPILVSTANGGFATLDFNYNLDNMTFGGTDFSSGADLKNDDVVFNLTFTAPTDPGRYAVDFDGLQVYGLDMAKQIVTQVNGAIIVDPDETTTTTEPGEKNGAKWIIDWKEAKPGEEVTLPVHVEGNTEGFNSFMTKIKVADGPILVSTANGGFATLDFNYNLDNMTFGGTDSSSGADLKDDDVVFNLTFTAPTEPGEYAVDFDGLEVYGLDMAKQIVVQQNGGIIVKADETTATTEPGEKNGAKWIIDWKEAKPGEEVTLPVHVEGNTEGFNSFMTKIKVADGPILVSTANGGFATLDFNYNLDNMTFGGTDSSSGADLKDDDVVFNLTFTAPTEPGEYAVDFDGLEVYGLDMAKQIVVQQNGGIIVKTDETTTTEATTTTEETTTTTTTTEETTTTTPIETSEAGLWYVETTVVAAGATVTLPVKVKGDTNGINSYIAKIQHDAALTANDASNGDAYEGMDFSYNMENLTFGGVNYTIDKNVVPTDNGVVFNIIFTAPSEPGRYPVEFLKDAGLTVYDINMNELDVKTQDGWIEVVAETTTTEAEPVPDETTTEETQTTAEETTTEETTTTTIETGEAGLWYVETTVVAAGATVTLPVKVTGDSNGINSYIAKLQHDAALTANDASNGDAYEGMDFSYNMENLTFGGVNYTIDKNVVPTDNGVVFNIIFTAPSEPGRYPVEFLKDAGLTVYDINMNELDVKTQDGWIEVIAETTTTEATETTPEETVDTTTEATETTPEETVDTTTEATETTAEVTTTEETTTTIETGEAGLWYVETTVVAAGATVTLPVKVIGDSNGINSYIAKLQHDAALTANDASNGDAYEGMDFSYNMENLTFGGVNYTIDKNVVPTDNGVVFNIIFTAPSEPGRYPVEFLKDAGLTVYDINMNELDVKTQDGWIEVIAESTTTEATETTPEETVDTTTEVTETTPEETVDTTTEVTETTPEETVDTTTEATETTPEETVDTTTEVTETTPEETVDTTTEATETTPEETVDTTTEETTTTIQIGEAGLWYVETTVVAAGATVTLPVKVTGDVNGINSYIAKLQHDAALTANDASNGDAYEGMDFSYNMENLTFGGVNYTIDKNVVPTDNGVVFNIIFTAPSEPGRYPVEFLKDAGLTVYDINMNELDVKTQDGWIEVIAESTTTEATETTPEETVDTTTEVTETTPEETVDTTTEVTETTPDTTTEVTETTPEETVDTTTEVTETTPEETVDTTTEVTETTPDTTTEVTETTPDTTTEVTETTPEETVDTTTEVTETTPEETVDTTTETTQEYTTTEETTTSEEETTDETTTSTSDNMGEMTETTTQEVKPIMAYAATWQIGNVVAHAGETVTLPITVSADIIDALTYCAYDFGLEHIFNQTNVTNADFQLTYIDPQTGEEKPCFGAVSGETYKEFGDLQTNPMNFTIGAQTDHDVPGFNNATILYLTYRIPDTAQPGVINVNFAGDVTAHNMTAADVFNIEEIGGTIQILPDSIAIDAMDYEYDIDALYKFYFSHDWREFSDKFETDENGNITAVTEIGRLRTDLLSVGTLRRREVLVDEETGEPYGYGNWTIANDLDGIAFVVGDNEGTAPDESINSPMAIFDNHFGAALEASDAGVENAFYRDNLPFKIVTTFQKWDPETKTAKPYTPDATLELVTLQKDENGELVLDENGNPIVEGKRKATSGTVYIAVKGDTNLNGKVKANDASLVLKYAADFGADLDPKIYKGTDPDPLMENFVYFLSDVDGESEDIGASNANKDGLDEDKDGVVDKDENGNVRYTASPLNARDASFQLIYATQWGADLNPDWWLILHGDTQPDKLPRYTKEIGKRPDDNTAQ